MANNVKESLHFFLRGFGFDLKRYDVTNFADVRRTKILYGHDITLTLDVGANTGQFGRLLRRLGYHGRMVSFEPLTDAFSALAAASSADSAWDCRHFALGDADTQAEMNVSGNSVSSSLLGMHENHAKSTAAAAYVTTETVTVRTLDSLARELLAPDDRIFLKLDVQGYEMSVLRGASDVLPQVRVIETELSLVPLYDGQTRYEEMIEYLGSEGFHLASVESCYVDLSSGHVLQIDGIFVKADR